MKGSLLKAGYYRRKVFGVRTPFYHSFLEIHYNGRIIKRGYYARNDFLWPVSLIIPIPGEFRKEKEGVDYYLVLSKNRKKIKKVLKILGEERFRWKVYSSIFRNCFHWRNKVLAAAGIKAPKKDWFFKR